VAWMLDQRKPTFVTLDMDANGELWEVTAISPYACCDPHPMSVEVAHQIMREHISCMDCRIRRNARCTLIEAGHLKPDSGRRSRYSLSAFDD